ncbi:MAG: putative FmdB family regulatory protein [Verrucomicrobiales bacterium]|jgi:putative FmdB family regulatory protein
MPTYEYHCEACEETFEYRQSMNDPRLEKCILDGCEGTVKRLLGTGAGIIFKGSGFYETDYRSESYKKGAEKANKSSSDSKSDSSSSGDSSKKTTKSTESKPASSTSSSSSTTKASSD